MGHKVNPKKFRLGWFLGYPFALKDNTYNNYLIIEFIKGILKKNMRRGPLRKPVKKLSEKDKKKKFKYAKRRGRFKRLSPILNRFGYFYSHSALAQIDEKLIIRIFIFDTIREDLRIQNRIWGRLSNWINRFFYRKKKLKFKHKWFQREMYNSKEWYKYNRRRTFRVYGKFKYARINYKKRMRNRNRIRSLVYNQLHRKLDAPRFVLEDLKRTNLTRLSYLINNPNFKHWWFYKLRVKKYYNTNSIKGIYGRKKTVNRSRFFWYLMNKYFKVKQKFKKNYKILKKKLIKFRVISKKKYVGRWYRHKPRKPLKIRIKQKRIKYILPAKSIIKRLRILKEMKKKRIITFMEYKFYKKIIKIYFKRVIKKNRLTTIRDKRKNKLLKKKTYLLKIIKKVKRFVYKNFSAIISYKRRNKGKTLNPKERFIIKKALIYLFRNKYITPFKKKKKVKGYKKERMLKYRLEKIRKQRKKIYEIMNYAPYDRNNIIIKKNFNLRNSRANKKDKRRKQKKYKRYRKRIGRFFSAILFKKMASVETNKIRLINILNTKNYDRANEKHRKKNKIKIFKRILKAKYFMSSMHRIMFKNKDFRPLNLTTIAPYKKHIKRFFKRNTLKRKNRIKEIFRQFSWKRQHHTKTLKGKNGKRKVKIQRKRFGLWLINYFTKSRRRYFSKLASPTSNMLGRAQLLTNSLYLLPFFIRYIQVTNKVYGNKFKIFFYNILLKLINIIIFFLKPSVFSKKLFLFYYYLLHKVYGFKYAVYRRMLHKLTGRKFKHRNHMILFNKIARIICYSLSKLGFKSFEISFFFFMNRKITAQTVVDYLIRRLGVRKYNLNQSLNPFLNEVKRAKYLYAGIKIIVAGRLTRKERASFIIKTVGKVMPLSTRRIKIDYANGHFLAKFGIVGIKVFILYKSEHMRKKALYHNMLRYKVYI